MNHTPSPFGSVFAPRSLGGSPQAPQTRSSREAARRQEINQLQDRLNSLRSHQDTVRALFAQTLNPSALVMVRTAEAAVRACEQQLRQLMQCG